MDTVEIEQVKTLLALLRYRAQASPEKIAFELEGQEYSFYWLWRAINEFGASLMARQIKKGECVLVAMPNNADFFPVFYGIQLAGGIPVPLFPNLGPKQIEKMKKRTGARFLVLLEKNAELVTVIEQIESAERMDPKGDFPIISQDDIAYLQYTSGSTGDPKGVQITHRNLLTNLRQMIPRMETSSEDVFVSWLPIYHDLGLIIMTMMPFYLAARAILLPTSFVNLRRWIATLEAERGTFTAGPDFGFRLALRYAGQKESYDLSSLRVALNAAEVARPSTIRDFERAFNLKNVMTVGYGLAEVTVGVSMTEPGKGVRVDEDGFAEAGPPFPEVELAILAENNQLAAPYETGEILARSPANTSGYFKDPEATQALFWKDGYIRTGDIGYLDDDGHVFVVGRLKEMVKHTGRTLAPREIEAVLEDHPEVRGVAAISADLGGLAGEQVVIFVELKKYRNVPEEKLHLMAVEMVGDVSNQLGLRPGRLYLSKPRTIPQTHNGKVQRALLRQNYLDGSLKGSGNLLYPEI